MQGIPNCTKLSQIISIVFVMSPIAMSSVTQTNKNDTSITAFTPHQIAKWELGVSLAIHFWKPLSDAVACGWGGPDSADKRDWLCGAIADMWITDPETDDYDVETTLLQVMEDEFSVNLEDDSAFEVRAPGRILIKI
jgi:pre-rRNA-processing protein TSR2